MRLQDFLQRVVPWPTLGGDGELRGWVNVVTLKNVSGQRSVPGPSRAFQTVGALLKGLPWLAGEQRDVYFCLTMQSQAEQREGKNGYVYHTAIRKQENAVSVKSLWMDVDVKPAHPDKGYPSFDAALRAVVDFHRGIGLPPPSIMVKSGGGLHVYWTFDRPLTVEEWLPLAERLKAAQIYHKLKSDAFVTDDAARILRVPGTVNSKNGSTVEVFWDQGPDYDLADLDKPLAPFAKYVVTRAVSAAVGTLPETFRGAKPPKLNTPMEIGDEGVEKIELRDPRPIINGCQFLKAAFATGGEKLIEPQWDLTCLSGVFMEKGREIAHAMARKHPDYTQESTDDKYDRKEAWVLNDGGGPPTCATIRNTGWDCTSCPLFGKIKSPLTIRPEFQAPPRAADSDEELAKEQLIPARFTIINGYVHALVWDPKEKKSEPVQLFENKLSDPDTYKGSMFGFTATLGVNPPVRVNISKADIGAQGMMSVLQGQGLTPCLGNANITHHIKVFLMSWMSRLEHFRAMNNAKNLGWVDSIKEDQKEGFVYGGFMYPVSGKKPTPVGYSDPKIEKDYSPRGSIAPWVTAANITMEQRRPDLHLILAGAFAGPLAYFSGQKGLMIMAFGESGAGKTTASLTSAAVWGHPIRSRLVVDSTPNHFSHKLGKVVSLPVYWDELREKKDLQHLAESMFSSTMGGEKGRLKRNLTLQESGEWATMLVASANHSLYDHIVTSKMDTGAAMYRVFEYEVDPVNVKEDSKHDHYYVDRLTNALETNFGVVGHEYIKYLVPRVAELRARIEERGREFDRVVSLRRAERFWSKVASTIIVGAELCNEMHIEGLIPFDIPLMTEFMSRTVATMRGRVVEETKTENDPCDTLTRFLKAHIQNILITDIAPDLNRKGGGTGRPAPVNILSRGHQFNKYPVYAQFIKDYNILRVDRKKFEEWASDYEIPCNPVYKALQKIHGMTRKRLSLGAGTGLTVGQEYVCEIPIGPMSPWRDLLSSWVPDDDDAPMVASGTP